MRYFDMRLDDVEKLTMYEYDLLSEAKRLQMADRDRDLHLMAWLNREINAKKKVGKDRYKPIYKKFSDFFDYKKVLNRANNKQQDEFSDIGKRVREFNRRNQNGGNI